MGQALEITARNQLTHGSAVQGQFTLQHIYGNAGSDDPYNFNYGRGNLGFDPGMTFSTSVIYDTPALRNQNGLVRNVFGGWQATSIIQLRGGLPFTVYSSQVMNDDINSSRANYNPAAGSVSLPSDQRNINRWFNTAAFSVPADYTWGNAGLNVLRGPGFAEVEASLQKSFSFYERYRITFRMEAENALNHVNLGQPAATLGSSNFGTIRSLAGDPRLMQAVLKFAF